VPVDLVLIAARWGKPGDIRQPIADGDQMHPTGLAAMRANARDLLKRHIDHAAYSQPVLLELAVWPHGEGLYCRQAERSTLMSARATSGRHVDLSEFMHSRDSGEK
jgi:hypothetical protein